MIWGQIAASFIVWVGAGVCAWRWLRTSSGMLASGRGTRIALGAAAMFGSVPLLYGMMVGLESMQAIRGGALTVTGWAAATIGGIVFTSLQVAAAALLLSAALPAETVPPPATSDRREGKKTS